MSGSPQAAYSVRLVIDWQRCRGRGVCAQLFPERIGVDEWGYPLLDGSLDGSLEAAELRRARATVRACPHGALRIAGG